jgi:hypothetical protein
VEQHREQAAHRARGVPVGEDLLQDVLAGADEDLSHDQRDHEADQEHGDVHADPVVHGDHSF